MTRKDYVAIAEALKSAAATETQKCNLDRNTWEVCVRAIAQAFQFDNPRFDARCFFQACELDS